MSDDTTSFESILANVKKRRAAFDQPVVRQTKTPNSQQSQLQGDELRQTSTPSTPQGNDVIASVREPNISLARGLKHSQPKPTPGGPVINSFNQQHDSADGNRLITHNEKKAGQASNIIDRTSSGKTMFVSSSQTGNPLLKSLTNVNWRYVKSTPTAQVHYDYQIRGRNIIFLSLKYHKLHPEYIGKKLLPFKRTNGNILLCVVDVENSEDVLRELNKICMFEGFTLLLAFTFEQAGKYLSFMVK